LILSDQETASFLFSVLPDSWLSSYQVYSPSKLLAALQAQAAVSFSLEDKVARAISFTMAPSST